MDANGTATSFSRFRPVSRQHRPVHVTSRDVVICRVHISTIARFLCTGTHSMQNRKVVYEERVVDAPS